MLFGPEPFLYPSVSPAVLAFIRVAYGLLLLATLVQLLPHVRRFFLSERWGGYAERAAWIDAVQNPVALPIVIAAWIGAAVALVIGHTVVPAAIVNVVLCRYFFIQMRWRGVLRGMGAPGFITYWLGLAVLLLEYTGLFAPRLQGLALLGLQVDFALIMLSAGRYKFAAGYRHADGMELGMVNPEWGYWSDFWARLPPGSWWFRLFNQLAWATEVVAAMLMLVPQTRFLGGLLILGSFVFVGTQIRLGFLCEMVIVCCVLFTHPGSFIDRGLTSLLPAAVPVTQADAAGHALLGAALWAYLLLLPAARAGLAYNFYAKKALPGALQRLFDAYTNLCGLIIWRVFSADIINFYVEIYERRQDGSRRRISEWGRSLRYSQVAESITVTSLFTTLKYYPSNPDLFVTRLMRYARTVPHDGAHALVFQYVSILKRQNRFEFEPVAEYTVDTSLGTVAARTLDASASVHALVTQSPIHEGARPGSYAPIRS